MTGSLTLGDKLGEQERERSNNWECNKLSGRRVLRERSSNDENSWMKSPSSQDEHLPMLADSPRLISQELERLTLGSSIAQTDQSWQEVTAKVRESMVPDGWRSQFDKEMQIFDLGDVGE